MLACSHARMPVQARSSPRLSSMCAGNASHVVRGRPADPHRTPHGPPREGSTVNGSPSLLSI